MENGDSHGHFIVELPAQVHIARCDGETLRIRWPFIREKLLILKTKALHAQKLKGLTRSYANWEPEQIRMAIIRGLMGQSTVELYLVSEESQIDGFFVTTCPNDEFLQAPMTLFLWLVWSSRPRLLERCESFVDQLALDRGCVQVEHTSGRMTWMRRQRTLGNGRRWVPSVITYRKELV